MGRYSKAVVSLTMFCGLAGASANAGVCPTTSLLSYLTPGFTCTLGIFTVKSFTFQTTGSALPSDSITLTPINQASQIGFTFSGTFSLNTPKTATYTISYFVDPPPDIIHGDQMDLDPSGAVSLQTDLCAVAFPCPGGSTLGTLVATPAKTTVGTLFNPNIHMVGVQHKLTVDASAAPATTNGFDNVLLLAVGAAAAPADGYQVAYAANLVSGDSVVNLTNSGTRNGFDPAGGICVNTYTFDPSEEMVACCTCYVSPDGLKSLSVKSDLLSNTLTPGVPGSVVIKLVATAAAGGVSSCSAAAPIDPVPNFAGGLRAWITTLHQNTVTGSFEATENVFQNSPLSDSELAKLTSYCGFIQANGSGFGVCRSCRFGGLGGAQH